MLESLSFPELLIFVLLGLLFFKENLLAWLSAKFGIRPTASKQEEPPAWAEQLMGYFNHDTTEHHEQISRKLDTVIDAGHKQTQLLENFDRYGVKCRNEV